MSASAASSVRVPGSRTEDRANAKRIDPKRRHLDGALPWTRLDNKRKDRFYVLAVGRGINIGEYDVAFYLSLAPGMGIPASEGYVVEKRTETGVQFAAGETCKVGEPLTFRDHVLLSCPLSFKRLLDEMGDNDAVGQRGADELKRAFHKTGSYDSNVSRASRTEGIRVQRDLRNGAMGDTDVEESQGEELPQED